MNGSRSVSLLVIVVLAAAAMAVTASHLPKANTRHDVTAYVEAAADVVRQHGPSCETFATPEWRGGPYYIFVDGPDDRAVCHPNAALIGKPFAAITNARDEKVGEMIAAKGKGAGRGWVEYYWAPPGEKIEKLKSTYVIGVTGPGGKHYVVGSGAWDLK